MTFRQPRSMALSMAVLAGLLLAPPASASSVDTYGATPTSLAFSNVVTATSEDGAAAYYNPAGLGIGGSNGKLSLQLGYIGTDPLFYVARQNKSDAALQANPTHLPPSEGAVYGALLIPLGGKIKNHASLGLTFAMPQSRFVRIESLEPSEPQWLRYQSNAGRIAATAGLGIRPIEQLSFGVGVQVLATFVGQVAFDVDTAAKQIDHRALTFDLTPAAAPTAGITYMPTKSVRLALAYRGPIGLKISQPDDVNINSVISGSLDINAYGTVLYTPHQIDFGAQYAPSDRMFFAFDLRFERWSVAPVPALHVSISSTGDELTQVLSALGVNASTVEPAVHFRDTFTPGVAWQFQATHFLKVRASYVYRPSYAQLPPAAPQPSGLAGENFLDASTHLVGAGATLQFNDPTEVFPRPLQLDLGIQAQIQPRVAVTKDEGDPVGNYAFGGVALAAGAGLRYEY